MTDGTEDERLIWVTNASEKCTERSDLGKGAGCPCYCFRCLNTGREKRGVPSFVVGPTRYVHTGEMARIPGMVGCYEQQASDEAYDANALKELPWARQGPEPWVPPTVAWAKCLLPTKGQEDVLKETECKEPETDPGA